MLSNEEKKENRKLMIAMGGVVLAVAILAIIGFLFINKPAEILQGQAEATSVRVSGKLPGRVTEFFVKEGDMVHKGDTLVHIHSSLVEAKLEQARAMETAAQAVDRKVDAGTRKQIIQSAYDVWQQAQAAIRRMAAGTGRRRHNPEDIRQDAESLLRRGNVGTETRRGQGRLRCRRSGGRRRQKPV